MMRLLFGLLLSVLPAVVFPDMMLPPTCGSPVITRRIARGTDAAEGAWPWQASVWYRGMSVCGGSLISDQWVLSAAHCFTQPLSFGLYRVRLGAYKLDMPNSNEVEVGVSSVFIHLQYNGISDTNSSGDVALVRLSRPVTYTRHICPVCIPSAYMDFPPGTNCYVTGWGRTQPDRLLPFPRTLQQVMVPLIGRESCYQMYHPDIIIHHDHICAGHPEGQRDACSKSKCSDRIRIYCSGSVQEKPDIYRTLYREAVSRTSPQQCYLLYIEVLSVIVQEGEEGDSGGPLVCKMNGYWYQVGIVSFGTFCALPNRPTIYATVSVYEPWIGYHIGQNVRSSSPSLEASVLLLVVSLILHS